MKCVCACVLCLLLLCVCVFVLSRRPQHLPSTEHVNVQVVDRLGPVSAVVDHQPESVSALLFAHLTGNKEQVAQHVLLRFRRLAQLRQASTIGVFGNDEDVRRGAGIHVAKGQRHVVFVHLGAGNFPRHEFVKNSAGLWHQEVVGSGARSIHGIGDLIVLVIAGRRRRRHVSSAPCLLSVNNVAVVQQVIVVDVGS